MARLPNPLKRGAAKPLKNTAATQARHVSTGTTYAAKGLAQDAGLTPPALDSEQGSSQPTRIIEFVPELTSPYQRLLAYTQMMNDAGVDVSMRAAKTPVLGAEFYVDPYSSDPNDIMIADFVEDNLSGGMTAPFLAALEDILRMYENGYSILEKVYELREWSGSAKGANARQYTMLKSLSARPASTISEIQYDNNGYVSQILHKAIQADKSQKDVTLKPNQLLVFTFNRNGGDITGRSLLRTAYPHWYYKIHFYKVDAVQKERHSLGVPRGKLLPGYNNQDKSILRTMLRNIRNNEESFIIQTPNLEVDFVELQGNLVDVLASAEHHNAMIMLNVMATFLSLGTSEKGGGNRAISATQSDTFMKSLRFVANSIADVINMFLIPELVVWNFPTRNFPKLCVRNIGETRDLQMLGAALANLFHEGGITPDLPTEQWIRRIFDMPLKQGADLSLGGSSTAEGDTAAATNGNGAAATTNGAANDKKNAVSDAIKTGNTGKPANAPPY